MGTSQESPDCKARLNLTGTHESSLRVFGALPESFITVNSSSNRTVIQGDALAWLQAPTVDISECSIITSLPDCSELGALSFEKWKSWFTQTALLLLQKTPPHGVTIFFQTDIKVDHVWTDKAYLIQKAAESASIPLLFHKIVCKVVPGNATYSRPGYSHLLGFSRSTKPTPALSTADVLAQTGEVTWARGMGVEACREACRFVQRETLTRTILDPFCGHGTVLAVANAMDLDAIGVELGGNRADKARRLNLLPNGKLEYRPRG